MCLDMKQEASEMYGQRKKDPVEEQNDRIINEWIVPAFVAFLMSALVYWALSK